jgi:hypothetical protein
MTVRTTRSTMVFRRSFHIQWIDHALPPGSYEVVTEDEQLHGISFLAFRRLQTYIYRQSDAKRKGLEQSYDVDPEDLAAAFARDGMELDASLHE